MSLCSAYFTSRCHYTQPNNFYQQVQKGESPKIWKTPRLLLTEKNLRKPTYRPLCLISCMGKLLKHLIKNKLIEEIDRTGCFADTQFGFIEWKSTIDASHGQSHGRSA